MGRRTQSIISSLLLITSAVLLVAVAVLYIRGRDNSDEPTPPTPIPGHNTLIDVLNAFVAEDLDATFGEQETGVRSQLLEGTGQTVELDSGRAYVFIYQDVASQEAATLDVLPEDVDLLDISGDPVDFDEISLYSGSNVAVVVVDADQETTDRVEAAVEALT